MFSNFCVRAYVSYSTFLCPSTSKWLVQLSQFTTASLSDFSFLFLSSLESCAGSQSSDGKGLWYPHWVQPLLTSASPISLLQADTHTQTLQVITCLFQLASQRFCWSNLWGEGKWVFPQGMWVLQRLTEPPGLLALTLHFSTEQKITFSLAARRGPKAGASQTLAKSCP